jgi:hypothetical protein
MKTNLYILTFVIFGFYCCSDRPDKTADRIVKIEMNLSAFGVESDDFPSIEAKIDFLKDTGICIKSYDNPLYKSSTYSLTKSELQAILRLLDISKLEKLKKEYKVGKTDQPRSTTKIYLTEKVFVVEDYGLAGDSPLQELYKIVYKY